MPGDRLLPKRLRSGDRDIDLRECRTDDRPRAVIQVLHGLAEHSARYDRFAMRASDAGYAVVTFDHRGHGPACAGDLLGHFADADGWNRVIDDVMAVNAAIRSAAPDRPVCLFGHSMGSFIAQCTVQRHPQAADRLVLSGSSWPNRAEARLARLLARLIAGVAGGRSRANLLDRMSFGKYNDRFKPNRTAFDWLSRDDAEVDKYVDDPLCGFVASNRLWYDLLGGILEITADGSLARMPKDLPVLMLGGELDPVGGRRGIAKLAERYRAAGIDDLTVRIYNGGRHEMLNETNRREVMDDIFDWLSPGSNRGVAASPGSNRSFLSEQRLES